jgi:hypothetical protein
MTRSKRIRLLRNAALVASLLLSLTTPARAADWNIVLNGKAIHVNAEQDWNEANWGLGFEREFSSESRWVKVALGNGFVDSQDEMSYMLGGGIKRRFRPRGLSRELYIDIGAIGFMMTRQDVDNNSAFPGILPALTVGMDNFALNFTFLPGEAADAITHVNNVDPNLDGIFFIQFKIDADLFSFGGDKRRRLTLASAD